MVKILTRLDRRNFALMVVESPSESFTSREEIHGDSCCCCNRFCSNLSDENRESDVMAVVAVAEEVRVAVVKELNDINDELDEVGVVGIGCVSMAISDEW